MSTALFHCCFKETFDRIICDRIIKEKKVVQGNTKEITKTEYGVLLLSTQKLRWLVERVSGFWKTTTSFLVLYEIPLEDIRGISGETGDSKSWHMFKQISIGDGKGENIFNRFPNRGDSKAHGEHISGCEYSTGK